MPTLASFQHGEAVVCFGEHNCIALAQAIAKAESDWQQLC